MQKIECTSATIRTTRQARALLAWLRIVWARSQQAAWEKNNRSPRFEIQKLWRSHISSHNMCGNFETFVWFGSLFRKEKPDSRQKGPVSWAFPMVKRKSAGGEVAKPKAKKGKEEALPPVEAKQLAMPHVKIFKEWL